jgi:hypothetical protein
VTGIKADGTLDKPTISKAYFEGEFWTVINALEAFRKTDKQVSREDSIYTFKYLSVVYAAEPSTRTKAESYMYQLLRMMPTIELLDLYISDNIQSIFMKVKGIFEKMEGTKPADAMAAVPAQPTNQPANQPANQTPVAPVESETAKADAPPAGKTFNLKIWAPLALGGVGIAAATYFLVSRGEESDAEALRPVDVTMEWPKEGSR